MVPGGGEWWIVVILPGLSLVRREVVVGKNWGSGFANDQSRDVWFVRESIRAMVELKCVILSA